MTRMYFSSRYWRFGRADGSVIADKIRLRRDGTIEGYYHPNEARWGLDTHGLFFCRADGVVTTRFGFESSSPAVLKGIFLFNENITHTLTEIDMVPLPKRRRLPWILPVRPNLGHPLLLNPDELDSFVITFAGTSEHPPHPNDLMRMLVAAGPSLPAKITLALELNGFAIVIKPREVVNIVTYSGSDNHDPPRSAREHQYYAGFRWEAHVRMGLDADDIVRLEEFGWPQLFNIKWWFRGKEPSYLYHSVYVSDVKEKSEIEFFHITDPHVARRNDLIPEVLSETRNRDDARRFRLRYNNFNDNLRSLIRKANKKNVDFIVMTGDLVDYYHDGILTDVDICLFYQDYEAGEVGERGGWLGNPAQETSNIRKFVEIVTGQDGRGEPLRCPIFCIPGNHDYLCMEPPLVMIINLNIILFTVRSDLRTPANMGLTDQEGAEFEYWKGTTGDSLGERLEKLRSDDGFDIIELSATRAVLYTIPNFEDNSQYLTEISYDTDFVVKVGSHRLICLNTGEDVCIPTDLLDLIDLSRCEKHFIDGESHNRGILLSHYGMINDAVVEVKSKGGKALVFTHAPLVRELGDFEWNKPAMVSGDEYCYYNAGDESENSIPGLDGAIAEWDSRIPVPMVRWLQNGAGGVDAIFSGHSHDIREYRIDNGIQVCKGEYSHDLQTIWPDRRDEWLDLHHPLQFISGALKKSAPKFRSIRIRDNHFQSLDMRDIPRFDKQDTMQIRYLFTALSIDLARFGGYHNEARNDLNPATHFYWAHAVHHRLMVMWDLMEKYWLQLLNIAYLQEEASFYGYSSMPEDLRKKLELVEAAIENAIPVYRRIVGGLLPTPDYWIVKDDFHGWRVRVFYAISAASLNQFGVDFGSPEKNSLDLKTHYEWVGFPSKRYRRLQDALEERIGKLVEFAHAGPCHLLAMWFASESVHLAPWSSWDNPARGSRDPGFHLAWALTQTREGILNELCEKYEFAARNQYQSLKDQGLEEFYIYHSVRMAAWGGSVGFLDEQPDPVYFQSLAAKLKAIAEYDSNAWVDFIIRDLQFRVKQTGFPLCDLLSYTEPSGVAKILFSIPGFGPDSALELAEEIKTIDRFKSDSSLALYLGMCPLDERWKRDKVNTRAKDAMWIGVNRHRKFVLESQRYYEKKRAEGKGHNRAIQALGRHMCRVIYTMLKEKREYQVACTHPQGVAKILFSIPGFGPDSALELAGEIKAIDRFKSDSSLALYLGMCPIDKRWKKDKVNTRAKDAMMAAVERHRKFVSESQRYYEKKRAEGKGHNRAIQALGRHMCHVIYKILREKREYYRIL